MVQVSSRNFAAVLDFLSILVLSLLAKSLVNQVVLGVLDQVSSSDFCWSTISERVLVSHSKWEIVTQEDGSYVTNDRIEDETQSWLGAQSGFADVVRGTCPTISACLMNSLPVVWHLSAPFWEVRNVFTCLFLLILWPVLVPGRVCTVQRAKRELRGSRCPLFSSSEWRGLVSGCQAWEGVRCQRCGSDSSYTDARIYQNGFFVVLLLGLEVFVPCFVFKKSDNEVNANAAVILELSS